MTNKPFLADINAIKTRARKKMEEGAVTEGYRADRTKIIELLNGVLATEIVCTLRYKNHYFMASGIYSEPVAEEFLEHAHDEQAHADMISERIVQLQGTPNWSPEGLHTRAHADYVEGTSLKQMIEENLVAERVAIDLYREIIDYIGSSDPTTRRMMEEILEAEEEHADDLANLLQGFKS